MIWHTQGVLDNWMTIGESTKREIAYAEKTGKKVNYLEES